FLRRFSWGILPVVAVRAAAGAVIAVIQVQNTSALVGTAYGRRLLVKLALLVFLFTLAAVNRLKLTASAEEVATEVQRRLT
ncbi:CopD family protein, partial [Mesorhizobium japonicum]|uniref:CopD family protein n=1 Tax=Mesorhizobium japonicum TaxID=2066070 RepID=UPI003B5CA776